MSGDRPVAPAFDLAAGEAVSLAEARFVPRRYEPNYAYPLLVLFHGRGGDEHQLIRSVPTMSWRNYIALSLRGPEVIRRDGEESGYGWGPDFARKPRRWAGPGPLSPAETVRRALHGGPQDLTDLGEAGTFAAIRELRRSLHVHSERIFLVGIGEGAAVAYRLGLTYPERFAGVVAMNGWLPGPATRPLARLKECRDLKVLVVHGEWNGRAPIDRARRDVALLRAAGLRVAFQSYPCANRLTSPMLSDVDTWLIHQCTADW
jgi:phospholipase/carboxylesterase